MPLLPPGPLLLPFPGVARPFGGDQAEIVLAVFVGDLFLLHHGGHPFGKAVGRDDLIRVRGAAVGQHRPFTQPGVVVAAGTVDQISQNVRTTFINELNKKTLVIESGACMI